MKKIMVWILLSTAMISHSQKVVSLYPGMAPGSESWNWQEKPFKAGIGTVIMDVSRPTLTAYLPAKPNGTSIIIVPGGAFHALAFDLEGTSVAKLLNEKGISAFVLKYRVVHDDPANPGNALMTLMAKKDFKKLDSIHKVIVPFAMEDGLAAVKYLRQHASEYRIDANKIGMMGFSAGGTVLLSVVYNSGDDNRPNFIAPIYADVNSAIGKAVPTAKTPVFIVVAGNDDFGLAPVNTQLYLKWLEAKQPAELHVYEKGGHGFGTKKQNLPVDHWMERFYDWLRLHSYLEQ